MSSLSGQQTATDAEDRPAHGNINDLACIIASEARGQNETAQAMVGWTVINRMKQHHVESVLAVSGHGTYAHGHCPTTTSLQLAERILNATATDISQGATHFYSPAAMPKEGEPLPRQIDIRGGLESVAGVTRNGHSVRNYAPGWAKSRAAIHVAGIEDKDFKFYRLS